MKNIDPTNTITYIVTFDIDLNVQLGRKLLRFHCPKFMVVNSVEHTVSLFFNYDSKIPTVN